MCDASRAIEYCPGTARIWRQASRARHTPHTAHTRAARRARLATKNWHLLSHNQRRVIAYRFVTHRRYIDVREPIEEQNFKMHAMSASHITHTDHSVSSTPDSGLRPAVLHLQNLRGGADTTLLACELYSLYTHAHRRIDRLRKALPKQPRVLADYRRELFAVLVERAAHGCVARTRQPWVGQQAPAQLRADSLQPPVYGRAARPIHTGHSEGLEAPPPHTAAGQLATWRGAILPARMPKQRG